MRRRDMLKLFLASVLGMLALVSLLGRMNASIGPFEFELNTGFSLKGITQLVLPPLGKIYATTHVPPLRLEALLKSVNFDLLQESALLYTQEKYVASIIKEGKLLLAVFGFKLLALGFIGGSLGAGMIISKKIKKILLGGLVGFLVVAMLLAAVLISYDPYAFVSPEFEGVLSAAPWIFGLMEEALVHVASLGEQLDTIAQGLFTLFERLEYLEPLGTVDGEKKLLCVSDIHNNPAAFDFIEQVARIFHVDMIIDTGDITDFGTPLETEIAFKLASLDIPYILVPGNHDSPEVIQNIRNFGAEVIEKGIVEIDGIRLAGIQDPSSFSTAMTVSPENVLAATAAELKTIIAQDPVPVDILAAHHPAIAASFGGEIPVILTGHTHVQSVEKIDSSIIINAGTTGAAGIRGLQSRGEIPFSLVLVHLNRDEDGSWQATAADTINVYYLKSGFSLSRILFVDLDDEEEGNDLTLDTYFSGLGEID